MVNEISSDQTSPSFASNPKNTNTKWCPVLSFQTFPWCNWKVKSKKALVSLLWWQTTKATWAHCWTSVKPIQLGCEIPEEWIRKGTEGGLYSRFFQGVFRWCGSFCAYIEVLYQLRGKFCVYDNACSCLRFHLCNSSFHNRLVINISGQKIVSSSKLCGRFMAFERSWGHRCAWEGYTRLAKALSNWKILNGGGGQPHIIVTSK